MLCLTKNFVIFSSFDRQQHETTPKYTKRTESSNIIKSRHKSTSLNPIHYNSKERISLNTIIQMDGDYDNYLQEHRPNKAFNLNFGLIFLIF